MIEHHEDCEFWLDDDFCDCDFWDRLDREQELHDETRESTQA